MITCPKHLDAACASSVAMHSPTLTEEIFKGCAAFSLSQESICYEFDINNQEGEVNDHVQVCKETCSGSRKFLKIDPFKFTLLRWRWMQSRNQVPE